MTKQGDQSGRYDLLPVQAPRLAGAALAVFAALAERRVAGKPLRAQMLKSIRIEKLRSAAIGVESPLMTIEVPPGEAPVAPLELAARSGALTPSEVAGRLLKALAACEQANPPLRAFIAQDADDLMAQANAATARYQ